MDVKLKDKAKRYANLYKEDLHGANLRGADLFDVDFGYANLRDADLTAASLFNADLRMADFRGANLCHADLQSARLYGTDLRGANVDESCWSLGKRSLGVKIDERIACQLLYHVINAMQSVDSEKVRKVCNNEDVLALANQYHKVDEFGKLKKVRKQSTQQGDK